MRLRSWVRWRTSAARALTARRSARVGASGIQTWGMQSAASSCANVSASTSSVLILASAIARVRSGLETTSRPALAESSSAMAQVFIVASSTTWSCGPSVAAKVRRAAGVVAMRRRVGVAPGAVRIATSAKRLCTSSPMVRTRFPLFGHQAGDTTPRDSRSWRNRVSRKGGHIASRTHGP
jgi:hypothetical protein